MIKKHLGDTIHIHGGGADLTFPHHNFKRQQGYSDLEIAQKRQALEDVLIPETRHQHVERLHQVGFSRCDIWFQCLNFASLIAIA